MTVEFVRTVDVENVSMIGTAVTIELSKPRYDRNVLVAVAKKYGLNADVFPVKSKKKNFLDGLRACEKDGLLQQVAEDEGSISFQIAEKTVEEEADGTRTALYDAKVRILYSKTDDKILCNNTEFSDKVRQLIIEWSEFYKKADVFTYLKNMFATSPGSEKLVALRRAGGFYFVPSNNQKFLDAFESFINEVDADAFGKIHIPDVESARKSTFHAYEDDVKKLCGELTKEIEKLSDEDGDMSEHVYKNRLDELKAAEIRLQNNEDLSLMKHKQARALMDEYKSSLEDFFKENEKIFKGKSKAKSTEPKAPKVPERPKLSPEDEQKLRDAVAAGMITQAVAEMAGVVFA